MKSENRISFTVSEQENTRIMNAINELNAALLPKLVSLTPKQRQELPKMRDKTLPFVEKAFEYSLIHPKFAPRFVDLSEFEIDLEAVRTLANYFRPLLNVVKQLDNTIILSGSEAYVAALSVYESAQEGMKRNVSAAEQVYNDLKQRFVRSSRQGDDEDELKGLE